MSGGLGRMVPPDDEHIQKYPLRLLMPRPIAVAEQVLAYRQDLRAYMNQGEEGACVGFSETWMMTILNAPFARKLSKYLPYGLYCRAQQIDEFPDGSEGTTVRSGCDVLRDEGHTLYRKGMDPCSWAPNAEFGIVTNRWTTSVDELRTAIGSGIPCVLGVNWYEGFDKPLKVGNEHWIGREDWGSIRGGHAICVYGVSDKRQAFKLMNSWGVAYPPVWLPFAAYERLMHEDGETTVPTDR